MSCCHQIHRYQWKHSAFLLTMPQQAAEGRALLCTATIHPQDTLGYPPEPLPMKPAILTVRLCSSSRLRDIKGFLILILILILIHGPACRPTSAAPPAIQVSSWRTSSPPPCSCYVTTSPSQTWTYAALRQSIHEDMTPSLSLSVSATATDIPGLISNGYCKHHMSCTKHRAKNEIIVQPTIHCSKLHCASEPYRDPELKISNSHAIKCRKSLGLIYLNIRGLCNQV